MEINMREAIGLVKIKETSGEKFKRLKKRVAALKDQRILLDLSAVEMVGYPGEFYEIVCMPNVTVAAPPDVATVLTTYSIVTGKEINCEIRERVIDEEPENPRIQTEGVRLAANAFLNGDNYVLPIVEDYISSVGLKGFIILRAINLTFEKALSEGKGLVVDVTGTVFEGGADSAIAQALAELRQKEYPVSVVGSDGMAAYVLVCGRVNTKVFPVEQRVRQFNRILPNTVLRFDRYNDKRSAKVDVAGRMGNGMVVSSTIVLFDGVDDEFINFHEIDTDCLYTDEDIICLGLSIPNVLMYKRRMCIHEIGIDGLFTGLSGCFRRINAGESHQISDGSFIDDEQFIRRGLEFRKIPYESSVYGRVLPAVKKGKK